VGELYICPYAKSQSETESAMKKNEYEILDFLFFMKTKTASKTAVIEET